MQRGIGSDCDCSSWILSYRNWSIHVDYSWKSKTWWYLGNPTLCKLETLLLQTIKSKWWSIESRHIRCPSTSFTCYKSLQMRFFLQLCSIWHDFNWNGTSRGPSAIALVIVMKLFRAIGFRCREISYLFHSLSGFRVSEQLGITPSERRRRKVAFTPDPAPQRNATQDSARHHTCMS